MSTSERCIPKEMLEILCAATTAEDLRRDLARLAADPETVHQAWVTHCRVLVAIIDDALAAVA